MHKQLTLVFSALAFSGLAFAQPVVVPLADAVYQVSYAANLNIGDSVVNLTNAGTLAGFLPNTNGAGNMCINVYTFDAQEEEIACCSCLVTPNGLNSLSVQSDLISNPLTPAIPTSVVIKLLSSLPAVDKTLNHTVCNPAGNLTSILLRGMVAWGSTLEPSASPGTYGVVNVPFIPASLSAAELTRLTSLCMFIQADGTGFGICKSCRLGALSGVKK